MYVDHDVVLGESLRILGNTRVRPRIRSLEPRSSLYGPAVEMEPRQPECQLIGAAVPAVDDVGRVAYGRSV